MGLPKVVLMFANSSLLVMYYLSSVQSGVIIKKMSLCDPTVNYPVKFYFLITTERNNVQYITANATFPYPLDKNIGVTGEADYVAGGHTLRVVTVKENYLCHALNKYLGDFWDEYARAMKIESKKCPMRAGYYEINHHKLNYDKIAALTFPLGSYHIKGQIMDNRNNSVIMCLIVDMEYAKV